VIKYRLHCSKGHEFEAWFSSSTAYDMQVESQQVCCPECDGHEVVKAVMAPNVALRGAAESVSSTVDKASTVAQVLREFRRALLAKAEDVGQRFPEEARKIHYGEAEPRGIAGTASGEEAQALIEEGIDILMLPPLPEEAN
jgi:hypothetical protein